MHLCVCVCLEGVVQTQGVSEVGHHRTAGGCSDLGRSTASLPAVVLWGRAVLFGHRSRHAACWTRLDCSPHELLPPLLLLPSLLPSLLPPLLPTPQLLLQVTLYTRGKKAITEQIADDTDYSYQQFARSVKHIQGDRKVCVFGRVGRLVAVECC